MPKRIPIKDHHQEIQLTVRRCLIALSFIVVAMSLLMIRLAYLQIYKHDIYITLSTKNWLDLVPTEPTRGLIYDRNGVLLAENIPVFSLDVIPNQANHLSEALEQLSHIVTLSDNDLTHFKQQLKQHRRFDEIPLKLKLTETEVARFIENQHQFPGFMIKARLLRHYPFGDNFSHVVGYVGRINARELREIDPTNYSASQYIGKLGIEKYYENLLHGQVGYEEVENDASGQPLRILKEIKATPGANLYLSLDSQLQLVADQALSGRGAVVVIEPETGEILAMVSRPGFNPNQFVTGLSTQEYQQLRDAIDRPLYNRALRGLYPFASTIKPYLALKALDLGHVNPDAVLFDPGWFKLHQANHIFHDSVRRGHGKVNLTKAIFASCNTYFYDLASKMGIQEIDEALSAFDFGQLSGVDLDDELAGVVASPDWKMRTKGINWFEGDTILSGIGHGFMQTTPLQLAHATATLANRGRRLTPHLLRGTQIPGESVQLMSSDTGGSIVVANHDHWNIVIHAMEEVIKNPQGTAHTFGPHHYTIAAKTGTGQVSRRRDPNKADLQESLPEKLRDHQLFIAFAPVDKPKIALAIVTENRHTAISTARIILNYYLGAKHAN